MCSRLGMNCTGVQWVGTTEGRRRGLFRLTFRRRRRRRRPQAGAMAFPAPLAAAADVCSDV